MVDGGGTIKVEVRYAPVGQQLLYSFAEHLVAAVAHTACTHTATGSEQVEVQLDTHFENDTAFGEKCVHHIDCILPCLTLNITFDRLY